jgi:hypothetical protein
MARLPLPPDRAAAQARPEGQSISTYFVYIFYISFYFLQLLQMSAGHGASGIRLP